MKNDDIYLIKQPKLGEIITDLRLKKGIAQEELVKRSTINLKTIRGIESGEISPRSFTVKMILEALEVNYNVSDFQGDLRFNETNKIVLTRAWIFAIVFLITWIIEGSVELLNYQNNREIFNGAFYGIVKVLTIVSCVITFAGFLRIAKIYNKRFLEIVVYVFATLYCLFELYDIFTIGITKEGYWTLTVIESVVFGITQVFFGAALLQLRDLFKPLILIDGIVEILAGLCLVSVILIDVGVLIQLPVAVMEIYILYKFSKLY